MAGGGFRDTTAAALQESLASVGPGSGETPSLLAREALSLTGAAAVQIYLWDPAGGFLYGAGNAGAGSGELESIGFPLGQDSGYIFFRSPLPLLLERKRLGRVARRTGVRLRRMKETPRLPLAGPEEATTAFISALKAKSPGTATHCTRVARYAATTALTMGLSEAGVCHVERCALLHDIGKLGVPEDVLEKPGALTPAEWSTIRLHPQLGVRILQSCRSLSAILPAVAMHHERYDGQGYPLGISGHDIPLEARIVNLCDAYDTMTNDRPYRHSMVPEEAIAQLKAGAGSQFDPVLVGVFTAHVFPALADGVLHTATELRCLR